MPEIMEAAKELYDADVKTNGMAINSPYKIIDRDGLTYKATIRSKDTGERFLEIVRPESYIGRVTLGTSAK